MWWFVFGIQTERASFRVCPGMLRFVIFALYYIGSFSCTYIFCIWQIRPTTTYYTRIPNEKEKLNAPSPPSSSYQQCSHCRPGHFSWEIQCSIVRVPPNTSSRDATRGYISSPGQLQQLNWDDSGDVLPWVFWKYYFTGLAGHIHVSSKSLCRGCKCRAWREESMSLTKMLKNQKTSLLASRPRYTFCHVFFFKYCY